MCKNKEEMVREKTIGRYMPINIHMSKDIKADLRADQKGQRWRDETREKVFTDKVLLETILEAIKKIDEYDDMPEIESFLTVVFKYWLVYFMLEHYQEFIDARLEIIQMFMDVTTVTGVMLNIDKIDWNTDLETDKGEGTIHEEDFQWWLAVGVYWVRYIHRYEEDLAEELKKLSLKHSEEDKKRAMGKARDLSLVTLDVGLSVTEKQRDNWLANLWLADSGASCHMSFDETGMFDCRDVQSKIKIGNTQTMTATKIDQKRVQLAQPDGTVMEFVLEECKLIPDLWVNLFSCSLAKIWQQYLCKESKIKLLNQERDFILISVPFKQRVTADQSSGY
jgi:hypothetical protein